MGLGIVSDLVRHAGFENELPTICELGVQLTFKTQKDVPFDTPVVSQVAGRVLDHADPDASKVTSTPGGSSGFALVLGPFYRRPIGRGKRNISHSHEVF